MQFQVPQFIEIEDKIFGPFSLRQFLYVVGAGGFSFILFFALEVWLWILTTFALLLIAAAFAFIRYNGRSFAVLLGALFKYLWLPRFYLWQRVEVKSPAPQLTLPNDQNKSSNPLKNLLFKLNTKKEAIPNREKQLPTQGVRGPQ